MAVLQVFMDEQSLYRWRLRADDNEIIASACTGFSKKVDCQRDVRRIIDLAPQTRVEDLTLDREPAGDGSLC